MSNKKSMYLTLFEEGGLAQRVESAKSHLEDCDVCPLACGVNRLEGELGVCKTGARAQVASFGPHPGEERPISGWRGSGTIFFARCNLRCVFCQNADISQLSFGAEYEAEELAEIMFSLQSRGCHNINLVSPSHVITQILEALNVAVDQGLKIPLVYNTGGYDSLEMLNLLDGVVDIYMPDMKYGDERKARKYSLINNYPEINQQAVLEMHRQVGDLKLDGDGVAYQGLLIRHLVLPNDIANSEAILQFLAEKVSKNVYLNIMAQYHPAFRADEYPELKHRVRPKAYQGVVKLAKDLGLRRLDVR